MRQIPLKFKLLEGEAYYRTLLKEMPRAKERIVVAAMIVLWGKKTDALFAEMIKAAKRGVQVHILLDNYTRLSTANPSLVRSTLRIQLKKTFLLLEELKTLGAKVTPVGKIGLNPYRGRCHIKITVIDDNAYSFGGINFSDSHFGNRDYMFHIKNPDIADCLEQLVGHVAAAPGALPDAELRLDNTNSILFDGGQPKDSIIYARACELARQAKRAWFVSQYSPSGELAQIMKNVESLYYFNLPNQLKGPASLAQAFDQQRYRVVNSYRTPRRFIHAKFILFELTNGKKALVSGSNNFSYRGVAFGTKEIALYSTDETLWQQLREFIDTYISQQ